MIVLKQDTRRKKKIYSDNRQMNFFHVKQFLQKFADAISNRNPAEAVSCFTDDAVYYAPADKHLIKGKDELLKLFTGLANNEPHVKLEWHNMVFDESQQVGAFEFTLSLKSMYHGIIILKIRNNKIYRMREYRYKSTYDWEQFAGKSSFANYPFSDELTFSGNLDSQNNFKKLMLNISEYWNTGNACRASECFAQDAVYMEPPDKQYYKNRKELKDFFQETSDIALMKMTWHYLVFNNSTQTGAGEYTFTWNNLIIHGIVIVQIKDNQVKLWREYQYHSDLDWKEFIGESDFNNRLIQNYI